MTCQNVSIPPDSGQTVGKGCNGSPRPTYQFPFLRFDEDWSFLRCAQRTDYWDRIKYIPLGHEGTYLSFGGDVRQVYESYDEQYWGDGPQGQGGWLVHHYLAHGDLHLTKSSRLFAELQAAFEDGRQGGPRPYDEDKLNLHQAFLDLGSLESPRHLTLRLGRQELYYGSGRLVDARFSLNTRISFDGAKVIAQAGNTHIEAFVTRPTLKKPGIFHDVPDSKKAFWGIYSATATRLDRSVEFYYFGYLAAQQPFSVGTAYFQSHTVGGRWAGKKDSFDFDEEANVQLGKFGRGDIRAWSVAFNNGHSLETTKGRPRISLRSDVTSGDNDLDDRHLGTFYPLYARGKYFGEADLNGPVNTIDLIPQLDIHFSRRLTTDLSYGAFWRESLQDGVYGFAGNLYKPGSSTRARFIGQQAEVDLNYVLAPHILLRAVYQHFFAGNFLKEVPPGHDVNYATAWFDYHF
jgi:hypothetical protein